MKDIKIYIKEKDTFSNLQILHVHVMLVWVNEKYTDCGTYSYAGFAYKGQREDHKGLPWR